MAEAPGVVCNTGTVTIPESGAGDPVPDVPTDTDGADGADGARDIPGADGTDRDGPATRSGPSMRSGHADGASAAETAPARTWRRVLLLGGIAAAVLVIDVLTKVLVVATIGLGENIRILGGLVYLTQIRNGGAAFSMATGMTWVLAIVALAVVAFIIRMAPRLRSTPWAVCLGLILGGALGNLTDRIFRAPGVLRGHVVDFISVFGPNAQYFPAFNAADSAITIGGVMLVLIALLGYDFDGRRHRSSRRGRAGESEASRDADRGADG